MSRNQPSLYEGHRLILDEAIDLSLASLRAYGESYRHWAVAYSGGKDSSATVTFVAWAIKAGLVPAPESLTVLYADTRMELPPLQQTAMALLELLRADGFETKVVMPALDDRFFVYMFGRGVPPSSNRFRWCTPQLKIEPMEAELIDLAVFYGHGDWVLEKTTNKIVYEGFGEQKMLMLTGVRLGESAVRDQRIAVSCSSKDGECGQGWMQVHAPQHVVDTLAPLLHWRLCHVYDWLYFDSSRHGYEVVTQIATIYGEDEVRTGCVGCPLASRDVALERLVKNPDWRHLTPLLGLKPLYRELKKSKYRLRKAEPEIRKDGKYSKNGQRMGPLTLEARGYGLETVLDIQARTGVDLINAVEEARIRELWAMGQWPDGWTGDEVRADQPIPLIHAVGGDLITQPLLLGG